MQFRSLIFIFYMLYSSCIFADGLVKDIAYGYCNISHPVEMFFPTRQVTCEKQHVIQQQEGGGDWGNISIISGSSHITTDLWGANGVINQGKVWTKTPENDGWGTTGDAETALAQAYKLGRWQLEYVYVLYNYNNNEWTSTLLNWDGASHAVYAVTWWFNFPAKYIRKAAYLIDKNNYFLLIDHIVQLPLLLIEGGLGIIYNLAGFFVGILMQPFDTLNAIIGGLWLIIKGVVLGIIDIPLSLYALAIAIL